jgi:hypothetical protein
VEKTVEYLDRDTIIPIFPRKAHASPLTSELSQISLRKKMITRSTTRYILISSR